jgi:hypothetical protein
MTDTKYELIPLVMALLLAAGLGFLALAEPVHAQSEGSRAHSFVVPTSTTKARVESDITNGGRTYSEIRCWNGSATVVYLGDSRNQEYPICTDTASCPEAVLSVATSNLWAKSASGTPSLTCITLR